MTAPWVNDMGEDDLKNEFATQDAAEMFSILRTAKCIERYDSISHQLLSELLVAIATGGEVVGGNNRGSDVFSPEYGKIEVKSRILGTDGEFPRISLKQHNLDKADWFVAVRWTKRFEFHDAVALPKIAVLPLFEGKMAGGKVAHASWKSWLAAPGSVSLAETVRAVIGSVERAAA